MRRTSAVGGLLLLVGGIAAACAAPPAATVSPTPAPSPTPACPAAQWLPEGQRIVDGILLIQVDAHTIRVKNHGTRDLWVAGPAAPVFAQVPCLGWVAEETDTTDLLQLPAGVWTELQYSLPVNWPPSYRALVELLDRPGGESIGVAWIGLAAPTGSATGSPPPPAATSALEPVRVFFTLAGAGDPCTTVAAVVRQVTGPVTLAVAVEELLRGPTEGEVAVEFSSGFGPGTADALQGIAVSGDGTAGVWFRDFRAAIPGASSSCRASALLASLDATLSEFPEIRQARYSFAGDEAAFYDWLGLAQPE